LVLALLAVCTQPLLHRLVVLLLLPLLRLLLLLPHLQL
jgi:hypothetical protein